MNRRYTKQDARVITNDVMETIAELLANGEEVTFHGFGTFYTLDYPGRKCRSVVDGEPIETPAHRVARFTAGAVLKRMVAGTEGFSA